MRNQKLFYKVNNNPYDVRFNEICKLVEAFGFTHKGGKGNHRVYSQIGIREILNFQNVKGKVKPYQIKQFLKLIQEYNLKLKEE